MKMKLLVICAAALFSASAAAAQEQPRKIENVGIIDLEGNPAQLPMWSEKNLLIFYVDPDRHKQNEEFIADMEENHRAAGDNLYGFGIINLADTGLPNWIVRSIARKRTAKNGATVLADVNRTLSTAWELGDCNNRFVLMIVSKEGELVFLRKGELTEADKEAFYRTVEKYK